MIKRFMALLASMLITSATYAFDINAMTDAERQQFRDEIRSYLLENPEVLMEAIRVLEDRQAAEQVQGDAALVARYANELFNDGFSYVGGNPDGDITVVEFLDYRCGYCKRAHPEVSALLEQDGNIRFVIKEFPILGEQSTLASRFALAVRNVGGDAAYLAAHNALMNESGAISIGSLRRLARNLGLDQEVVIASMDAPEVDQILQANYALAQAMQITGTPSFVFGEQMIRGYAPLATMQQVIADQRG